MKTALILFVTIGCLSIPFASSAKGGNLNSVHIGISPYQSADDAQVIRRHVGQFILEAPPNTSVVVHDAYGLTEIARFQIPQLRFDSPGERAQRMKEPFSKLAEWYKRLPKGADTPRLQGSGALRIPEFLQALSQQSAGEPYAAIMMGSPFNLAVEEPSFSMVGGRVPSDGHLMTNLAASIYGTAEKTNQLHGCVVHFCYLHEDIWANRLVKESVQRLWGLFVSQQAGSLVDFTADMSRAFASLTQGGLTAVGPYQLDPADSILEMRVVKERWIPVREEKKAAIAVVPVVTNIPPNHISVTVTTTVVEIQKVYETNTVVREVEVPVIQVVTNVLVVTNVPPIPVAPMGRMGIAAWWAADADVDLYVSVHGQCDLFFNNTANKYGKYYRDIRIANPATAQEAWRDQWEYVELFENAVGEEFHCWLNLYKVNSRVTQPITGKVRVQFRDGHFMEIPFRFTVKQGNGGADSVRRQSSPYWVPIDLHAANTMK